MIPEPQALPLPWINLWDAPNALRSRNRIVARIPRGTPVEILETTVEGWTRIRARGPEGPLEGWVHRTFLAGEWRS